MNDVDPQAWLANVQAPAIAEHSAYRLDELPAMNKKRKPRTLS